MSSLAAQVLSLLHVHRYSWFVNGYIESAQKRMRHLPHSLENISHFAIHGHVHHIAPVADGLIIHE